MPVNVKNDIFQELSMIKTIRTTVILSLSCISTLWMGGCRNAGMDMAFNNIQVEFGKSINVPFSMSQFVDTVRYQQIDSAYTIGHISEVKMAGGFFYICDKHEGIIYKVSQQGKVLLRLANKGRARNEYYNLSDVDVNRKTGEIHVWDAVSHRFIVYSGDGTFVKDVPCNDVVRDFAVMDDGDYLIYTPDFNKESRRGLWLVDSHGAFIRQLVEIDEDFRYGGLYPNYLVCLGRNRYGLMGGEDHDNIYEIKDGTAIVRHHLEFGITIPKKLLERTLVNFHNHKGEVYTKSNYLENSRWLLFQSSDMQQACMSLYDKKENRYHQISKPEDIVHDVGLYGEAVYMDDSIYVCVIEPNDYPDKREFSKIPVSLGSNTNPILVIGSTKQ